ncbi:uncharacterized protein PFL1_01584 [Pseudozyma flocculosa PF-1]|uniref:Related to transcription activator amyR n=1 Tax=Pseudozyma flocculosa TaxID=84751 RepID=A0A5C3EXM1_9BASI|nr:uncharacterized protein PFL1_01584 [Pseudozyma flocculosa PF-1]EPQ30683.1 hypothetical protein PFL1_01584 [Pseudozyma flocculosa PF-1]SPO36984.1 related to transcription activator amyR [Pseudozyma flocculosa]
MPKDRTDPKKTIRRACDACHHRRVRCNHANPCDNCVRLGIPCSWIKASKGKQASGRRIDLLRKGHNPAAGDLGPDAVAASSSSSLPAAGPSVSTGQHAMSLQSAPVAAAHYAPHGQMSPPQGHPRDGGSSGRWREYDGGVGAQDGAGPSQWSHRDAARSPPTPSRTGPPRYLPSTSQGLYQQTSAHHHANPHYNGAAEPPLHPQHHQNHHHQQSLQQPQHVNGPPSSMQTSGSTLAAAYGLRSRRSSLTPVAPSFNPSDNFNEVLGNSFSELAPDVAAGFRLPDFGTSLADTYFNAAQQQSQDGSRRNVLMDMPYFGGSGGGGAGPGGGPAMPLPDGPGGFAPGNGSNGQRPTVLDVLGKSNLAHGRQDSTPGSVSYSDISAIDPQSDSHPLADSVLIPTIALFFERLQSIMPVFTRAWIFSKLDQNEHHVDPQFGSMLIAMSAFALIQPVEASDPVAIHARKRRVRKLLQEAVRMRTSAFFGENPSLEATMTSFFIFGTLFGLGEENAAWFRLREAVTLGHLLRLHEPAAYESLDKAEQERRLRAYWLLAITERAYAIQSGHSITFRGNPRAATAAIRRKFDVSQLEDFPNIQSRLFDVVDEKFVDCWNKKCPGKGCTYLDAERAISLHAAIIGAEEDPDPRPLSGADGDARGERNGGHPTAAHSNPAATSSSSAAGAGPKVKQEHRGSSAGYASTSDWHKAKVQKADVDVTRQWLLNRLWLTCLSHELLTPDNEHSCLRIDYAIDIARETLRVCNALSLRSMEAHGIGLTRKLNDIAQTLVVVCREFPAIAMSVPYEGDPINLAPSQFGPHTGPSPSEHHGSPTLHGTTESPIQAASTGTTGAGGPTATTPLGSKAFSPSFAIEAILHKYLDLFKRFRGGDHPYLPELVEAVKELPKMAELSFDKFLREMGLF